MVFIAAVDLTRGYVSQNFFQAGRGKLKFAIPTTFPSLPASEETRRLFSEAVINERS